MARYSTIIASPVGALTLVASDDALLAILWEDHPPDRVLIGETEARPEHPVLMATARQLSDYFAGRRTGFSLPLDPIGTAFQKSVWAALQTIPYGQTRSYGEMARALGRPKAARAVGAANGRNPLSIVVPCHRLVGADGGLTGFAGGLEAKRHLLALERGLHSEA